MKTGTNNNSLQFQKNYQNSFFEIGLVLILIGVQLGTAIRNVFPGLELVNMLMALGLLFIIDYNSLFKLRIQNYKLFYTFTIFNLISFIYSIVTPAHKFPELSSQIFFMQLYIFALIFALSTNSVDRVSLKNFDRYLFYVSGFISIVILYQSTKGFTGIYLENVFADAASDSNQMAEGGDKTTMGRVLYLSFITTILYKHKNIPELIIKPFLIFSAFLGLYMFNTRASIVLSLFSMLLYYFKYVYRKEPFRNKKRNNGIIYLMIVLLAIIGLIYLYNTNLYFQTMVDIIYKNIQNGINSFIGGKNNDESAGVRKANLKVVMPLIYQSNIFEILLGHGFITYFIDMPVLQAYFDLGIVGFVFYFISLIVLPLIFIFKKNYTNTHLIIIQLFALHYLVDQIYAGMPYWSFQFCPILLLIFFNRYTKTHRK